MTFITAKYHVQTLLNCFKLHYKNTFLIFHSENEGNPSSLPPDVLETCRPLYRLRKHDLHCLQPSLKITQNNPNDVFYNFLYLNSKVLTFWIL